MNLVLAILWHSFDTTVQEDLSSVRCRVGSNCGVAMAVDVGPRQTPV